MRKISATAQRVDESSVFENRKLLPKQKIDEETAKHPNLQNQQSQSKKDQQQRRGTGKGHAGDNQSKYHQQKEDAVDKDAERSNARPVSDSFI